MAERCPKCQRDTIDYPTDALGRVSLACWSCGWREPHTVRRPEPAPLGGARPRTTADVIADRRARILAALGTAPSFGISALARVVSCNRLALQFVLDQLVAEGAVLVIPTPQSADFREKMHYQRATTGQERAA